MRMGSVEGYELNVHNDGAFFYDPFRYDGVEIPVYVPKVGFDELCEIIKKANENPLSGLYYTCPGQKPKDALFKISNDYDVLMMYDIAYCYGKIDVFMDHFDDDEDIMKYVTDILKPPEDEHEASVIDNLEDAPEDEHENPAKKQEVADTDSEDEDYVLKPGEDDDSDTESDAASIDFLSENEIELKEVRTRRAEEKKNPKVREQPQLGKFAVNEKPDMYETICEHEEFMTELSRKMKVSDDNDIDPFKSAAHIEKYPIHDTQMHWKLQKAQIGERFESAKKFKECMTFYGLSNGYNIYFSRCSSSQIVAKCGHRPPRLKDPSKGKQRKQNRYPDVVKSNGPKCPFRCYARIMRTEESFQVISLVDVHTCVRNFRFGSLINYKWIGKQFGDKIRSNPSIRLVDIADLVMKKYKCTVTSNQCRRAKEYAIVEYEKALEDHYGMLRSYADELLTSNPGSTVKIGVTVNPDEKVYFDRIYICLKGLKVGWIRGCRRIIALDGCFLKSSNHGELLTAIGSDGNNHIFPIAWVVVNVENKDNWSWFIQLLAEDLQIEGGVGVTLMSDQHKGLMEAVKTVLPHAEHRQCARHIYENFRKQFSGVEFRSLFWAASKSSYPVLFKKIMDKIHQANPRAAVYLLERDPKTWSRAFFALHRGCEAVENGFSECFNSVIVALRNKPIITMLEAIRVIVMERMNTMRKLCLKWDGAICPAIQKKLEWCKDQHRFWLPMFCGGYEWEVRQCNKGFKVNEQHKTCSCRMWQLSGVPCPHACSMIFALHKNPEDYVADWFKNTMYMNAYKTYLKPVGGMSTWRPNNMNKPLPPLPKKMPGRPKKKRIRAVGEGGSATRISRVGTVITCHNCWQTGHNRKGCTNDPVTPPKKDMNVGSAPSMHGFGSGSGGSDEAGSSMHEVGSSSAGSTTTMQMGKKICYTTSYRKHIDELMGAGPIQGIFAGGSNPEHFFLGSSHGAKKGVGLGVTSAPGVPRPNAKYETGPIKRPLPYWWGYGLCTDPVTGEVFEGRGKNCVPIPVWPPEVPLPITQDDVHAVVGDEIEDRNLVDSEELPLGSQEQLD